MGNFIKYFRDVQVRVPDPLRPGHRTFEERLIPTGGTTISHNGETYEADEDGWFDVPPDVAEYLIRFRSPNGEHFCTPEQVDEQVRLGAMDDDGLPQTKKRAVEKLSRR